MMKFSHPTMSDRVEKLARVYLQNLLHSLLETLFPQVVQRLMLRAPRAKPERERQEFLLLRGSITRLHGSLPTLEGAISGHQQRLASGGRSILVGRGGPAGSR